MSQVLLHPAQLDRGPVVEISSQVLVGPQDTGQPQHAILLGGDGDKVSCASRP